MEKTLFLVLISIVSNAQHLLLSTKSDSAVYYYYEGWRQVLDEGNYSASEKAYRKMIAFDPDFLIGLSLVGRISTELAERKKIESLLERRKSEVKGDERLLMDVFMELLKLTNLRERNPTMAKEQHHKTMALAENNFRVISRRYPDDLYYRVEYLEMIHHNHGAAAALDSLNKWKDLKAKNNLFLLGFEALLDAELGHFDTAFKKSIVLHELNHGLPTPRVSVTQGAILLMKGDSAEAEYHIDRALKMDPKNVDAVRLKAKLK